RLDGTDESFVGGGIADPARDRPPVLDIADGHAELRNSRHEFTGAIQRIYDPHVFLVQAGMVVEGFLRQPAFTLAQQFAAKHHVNRPVRFGNRIMSDLVFGRNFTCGEAAQNLTRGFEGRLDTFQNVSVGILSHRVVSRRQSGPKHPGAGCEKHGAENTAQPGDRNASAELRTQKPAWDGPDQKRGYQSRIDISEPKVQNTGYPGQDYGMNDVGADHYLGRETVEQQQEHHNDASGADRGHAHQKTSQQPNRGHAHK